MAATRHKSMESLVVLLLATATLNYPMFTNGYKCIQEGGMPIVPLPDTNGTVPPPGAKFCKDLTPDNVTCVPLVWRSNACQGGFYLNLLRGAILPCPAGYYCPENTVCVVPCPEGAFCVQSNLTVSGNGRTQCKPDYETVQVVNLSNGSSAVKCGGPASLKTAKCYSGFYCPSINESYVCPAGHYCRAGRVSPQPCPLLSKCKAGTTAPVLNGIGFFLDLVLIVLVFAFWLALKYKHELKKAFQKHVSSRIFKTHSYQLHRDSPDTLTSAIEQERRLRAPYDPENGATIDSEEIADAGMLPKAFTVNICFKDLSLTLNSNKRKVLQGATGELRPKTLTAIMGGSGAGKTTLLNALSGKAYYGKVEGLVEINGVPADISRYRSIMGFVPQEDIMHRDLTAREVLYFQSMLRLSGCASFEVINKKVDDVLALLGLSHISDSQIGDEEKRGISGGQRKRVNIGMELVADPTLLFLDEPTSGLDSVSSMQVCEALRRVAEDGHLTVVAVLHQPRFEIFQMFHEVILLQPGGTIAFQGSTLEAKDYFTDMGYPVSPNVNPSDHYLDVIDQHNKKAEAAGRSRLSSASSNVTDSGFKHLQTLGDMWTTRQQSTDGGTSINSLPASCSQDFTARKPANFFVQLLFFMHRAFVLQLRQLGVLILDQFLVLIAGAVLGALYSEVLLQKLALLLCMTSMAVALTSMLAALRCFGNNKPVFWRESSAGINRPAYFLAVNISQIPIILLTPVVFLSLFYALVSPRTLFRDYYVAVLMLVWATHGLGYLISIIFNHRSSQMATVVVVLVSAMLSGAQPSLCKMKKYKIIGPIIYSLSFARWFVEALFEKEALRYPSVLVNEVALYSSLQGYSLDKFALCLGILFLFGLITRVAALFCLMFTNRGQQK